MIPILNTVKAYADKSVERMTSLGELNLRAFNRLAGQQPVTMTLLMEHGNRTLALMTGTPSYHEFLQGQCVAAKDLSTRLMTATRDGLAVAGEIREDYRAWFTKNWDEVTTDLRSAMPVA